MSITTDTARVTLPNGLVLAAAQNPAHPSVVIRLALAGGQAVEPWERAGVAEVLSRVVLQRSQHLSPDDIDRILDEHGIVLARGNDRHATELVARCPAESINPALDLLGELVQHPLFVDDSVRATVRQLQRSVALQAGDPRGAAAAALRALAYPPEHPYARQPYGSVNTLAAISAADVAAFFRRQARPERAVLVVAGDVRLEALEARVRKAFDGWSADGREVGAPMPIGDVPSPRGARRDLSLEHAGVAEVIVGGPATGRRAHDFRALQLGTLILGQVGLKGRLGARLREREGLAYACYAALEDAPASGLWTARASVQPTDVERTVGGVLDELRRMQDEPVTDDELTACRALCRGAFALQRETNGGLASLLQGMVEQDLEGDYFERFPDVLDRVRPADIQHACQSWLPTQDPLIVTACPR